MNQQEFLYFFGLKISQDVFATIAITISIFILGGFAKLIYNFFKDRRHISKIRTYIQSSLIYLTHSINSQINYNKKTIRLFRKDTKLNSLKGFIPNFEIDISLNVNLTNEIPYIEFFKALTRRFWFEKKKNSITDFQLLLSHFSLSRSLYSQLLESNSLNNTEFNKRSDNIVALTKKSDEIIQDRFKEDLDVKGNITKLNNELIAIKINFSQIHDLSIDSFVVNYADKIIDLFEKTYGKDSPVPLIRIANEIKYEYFQLIDYKKSLIQNLEQWNKILNSIKDHCIKVLENELEHKYIYPTIEANK